jgi:Icc protein
MRPVQLLHLTDPHLYADETRELYEVNTADSLRAVLADALGPGRQRPDAILVTGDIAEDESRDAYLNFRRALSAFDGPVLCAPGNHDAPATMAATLDGDGFRYCGAMLLGGWQIIVLASHVSRSPAGRIAPAELERLEASLESQRGMPTLVAVHHPPVRVQSRWLDGVGLQNAAELLEVLDRHPQARCVLSGHVHQEVDVLHRRVRVLTTPSTCAQFLPRTDNCVMDQRPPAYRRLGLQADGRVDTSVTWLESWRAAKPVRATRQGPY